MSPKQRLIFKRVSGRDRIKFSGNQSFYFKIAALYKRPSTQK